MRIITFVPLLLICLVLMTACYPEVNKEEAEEYLDYFERELSLFVDEFENTGSFKVLNSLLNEPEAPMPVFFRKPGQQKTPQSFDELSGLYEYDSISSCFLKIRESDSLIIRFKKATTGNRLVTFLVSRHMDDSVSLATRLPLVHESAMYIGLEKVYSLRINTRYQRNLPVESALLLKLNNYSLKADLMMEQKRTRTDIDFQVTGYKGSEQIILWLLSATAAHNEDRLQLTSLQTQYYQSPVIIRAVADRADDNAEIDFLSNFYAHGSVNLFRMSDGFKIGAIKLNAEAESSNPDFSFEYNDGSVVVLDEKNPTLVRLMRLLGQAN
jgi:hypothetical protein